MFNIQGSINIAIHEHKRISTKTLAYLVLLLGTELFCTVVLNGFEPTTQTGPCVLKDVMIV